MFLFRGGCHLVKPSWAQSSGRRLFTSLEVRNGRGLIVNGDKHGASVWLLRRGFRLKRNNKPISETQPIKQQVTSWDNAATSVSWSTLGRPLVFTVAFSGFSFGLASIWQYENMREFAKTRSKGVRQKANALWQEMAKNTPTEKAGAWRQELNSLWNSLNEGQRVFVPICAANVAVFLMWRIPALAPFMMRYFTANPAVSNTGLPMILSAFSHQSPLHLFCNMYVLNSFCGPVVQSLGKEQFVGLYFSSAVTSAFASHVAKVAFGRANGFSLGASGAICTVLGLFGTLAPDAQMQIILLPMFTFSAASAVKALIAFDTCGMIAGWQLLDHAAHLGGVLTGVWWVYHGHDLVWGNRGPLMNLWHELRDSTKDK